jgi:hypothetical protein
MSLDDRGADAFLVALLGPAERALPFIAPVEQSQENSGMGARVARVVRVAGVVGV